jgi:peroxiredoxin
MRQLLILSTIVQFSWFVAATEPDKTVDAEKALEAIKADWQREQDKYQLAVNGLVKTAAGRKELAKLRPDEEAFASRYLKLAEQYPDTQQELASLIWASLKATESEPGKKATKMLVEGRIKRATPTELMHAINSFREGFIYFNCCSTQVIPTVFKLAQDSPKDSSSGRLLSWICLQTVDYSTEKPSKEFQQAADLILEKHATDPGISHLCEVLGTLGTPRWAAEFEKHISTIAKNNKDMLVVLTARFAECKLKLSQGSEYNQDAAKMFRTYMKDIQDGVIKTKSDTENMKSNAESLVYDATQYIKQIETCSAGQIAPEFAGKDLDGKSLKLKDFRGKVVLLVFWGSRCRPCMADVPHEKELVEKFKDRPFEIIGVNCDSNVDDAKSAVKKHGMSWRSFSDVGENGREATKNYVVHGLPSVYVIDHDGNIQENNLRGKALNEPLEHLIVLAEKAARLKTKPSEAKDK